MVMPAMPPPTMQTSVALFSVRGSRDGAGSWAVASQRDRLPWLPADLEANEFEERSGAVDGPSGSNIGVAPASGKGAPVKGAATASGGTWAEDGFESGGTDGSAAALFIRKPIRMRVVASV